MADLLLGLAVLASVSALFGLGWYLGRRTEIQHRVDAALRHETRLRHPAAVRWPAPRHAQPAPWPVRGLSAREAMAGAEALSAAVRDFGYPVPRDTPAAIRALSDAARGSEC
jgi:hypothetical protein